MILDLIIPINLYFFFKNNHFVLYGIIKKVFPLKLDGAITFNNFNSDKHFAWECNLCRTLICVLSEKNLENIEII